MIDKKITTKDQKDAVDWFIGKAKSPYGYRKNLVNNRERLRTSVQMGKMYFFYYDPKHKETLPVYDRCPLVFPIERYNDGFLGLNVHYLSVPERSSLLSELMKFANSSTLTEKTKLQLSYDLLQAAKGLSSLARPCIKRYLKGHFRSKFVEITADEWDKVIALPVQNFVRKN